MSLLKTIDGILAFYKMTTGLSEVKKPEGRSIYYWSTEYFLLFYTALLLGYCYQ